MRVGVRFRFTWGCGRVGLRVYLGSGGGGGGVRGWDDGDGEGGRQSARFNTSMRANVDASASVQVNVCVSVGTRQGRHEQSIQGFLRMALSWMCLLALTASSKFPAELPRNAQPDTESSNIGHFCAVTHNYGALYQRRNK